MEILEWKGEDLRAQYDDCKTVEDVIQKLEGLYWKDGKVICEVSINGEVLGEQDEELSGRRSFATVNDIKIKISSLDSLIVQTKRSVVKMLSEVSEDSQFCAIAFRKNQIVKAQGVFDECIQKVQLALSLTTYMVQTLSDKKGEALQSEWSRLQGRFLILSKELFASFKGKDYVVVSDLLEYELTSLATDWSNWISEI